LSTGGKNFFLGKKGPSFVVSSCGKRLFFGQTFLFLGKRVVQQTVRFPSSFGGGLPFLEGALGKKKTVSHRPRPLWPPNLFWFPRNRPLERPLKFILLAFLAPIWGSFFFCRVQIFARLFFFVGVFLENPQPTLFFWGGGTPPLLGGLFPFFVKKKKLFLYTNLFFPDLWQPPVGGRF